MAIRSLDRHLRTQGISGRSIDLSSGILSVRGKDYPDCRRKMAVICRPGKINFLGLQPTVMLASFPVQIFTLRGKEQLRTPPDAQQYYE